MTRRGGYKRRRVIRRRPRRSRPIRRSARYSQFRPIHFKTQSLDVITWGTTTANLHIKWQSQNIPGFVTNFDQWKLNKVVFKLLPNFSATGLNNTTPQPVARGYTQINLDGGNPNPPANFNFNSNSTAKLFTHNRKHTRVIRPKLLFDTEASQAAVLLPDSVMRNAWIDIGSTTEPIYRGLDVILEGYTGLVRPNMKIQTIFYWSVRNRL
ncbi:putative cp [Little bittern circovirus]|uniref:putative cp n=1 Tax=Little bittern circovirus TaxID=2922909 RepID=UPI00406E05B1|nr:putative cp [Little bittern circovirus]